jgi:chromate reductase, NAD(P)H dehydrogenase (quinone)
MAMSASMSVVTKAQRRVRLLVFGASLRDASLNAQLAEFAARVVEWHGAEAVRARLADFDCPLYDDDAASHAMPDGVDYFRTLVAECDGVVIASPEYNGSMPGVLKNLIDWSSQFFPHPFDAHHALLLSAGQSATGGSNGLWALRVPLEHLGMRVYPEMFSLAFADKALDATGRVSNSAIAERFEDLVGAFIQLVEATKYYNPLVARYAGRRQETSVSALSGR